MHELSYHIPRMGIIITTQCGYPEDHKALPRQARSSTEANTIINLGLISNQGFGVLKHLKCNCLGQNDLESTLSKTCSAEISSVVPKASRISSEFGA